MRTAHFKQSFFIRSLMIVMSTLYVFSPLHSELNFFLHKLSHQFVFEDHYLEKLNIKNHTHHKDHHEHDFLASNHSEESKDHHKKEKIENHTHKLISFFNFIFNNDSSKDNKEKHIFEKKIDKHILSNKIDLPQSVLVYKDKNLWGYYSLVGSLDLEITIPPPRNYPA